MDIDDIQAKAHQIITDHMTRCKVAEASATHGSVAVSTHIQACLHELMGHLFDERNTGAPVFVPETSLGQPTIPPLDPSAALPPSEEIFSPRPR